LLDLKFSSSTDLRKYTHIPIPTADNIPNAIALALAINSRTLAETNRDPITIGRFVASAAIQHRRL
jgi:hypothetical protein